MKDLARLAHTQWNCKYKECSHPKIAVWRCSGSYKKM